MLRIDGVFAIYQCLLSDNKASLKYSVGGMLNLTMLNARMNSCELLLMTGGLSHLMGALQKTFAQDDIETTVYCLKALTNFITHRTPVVKILVVELQYIDIVLDQIKLMFQNLLKYSADEVGTTTKAINVKKRNNYLRLAITAGLDTIKSTIGGGINGSASNSGGVSQNKIALVEKTKFLVISNKIVE